MRVTYLTSFPVIRGPDGTVSSNGASVRYRMILPGEILRGMGYEIDYVTIADLGQLGELAKSVAGDIVVIGKFFVAPKDVEYFQSAIDQMRRRRIRVIADFCDNYFHDPASEPYRFSVALARACDELACNTAVMAVAINRAVGLSATAIIDPVEGRRKPARFAPRPPALKLSWYGYPGGIPFLFGLIERWILRGFKHAIEIEVLTQPSPEAQRATELAYRASNGRCRIVTKPWSREATWGAIERSDTVLLPSKASAFTNTKSPNRLLEAIYGGRLGLASDLPCYRELADFCLIDSDRAATDSLLEWTLDQASIIDRIQAGQDYIEQNYLPIHAAKAWDRLFRG